MVFGVQKQQEWIKLYGFCTRCFQNEPKIQEPELGGQKAARMHQALCFLHTFPGKRMKIYRNFNREVQRQRGRIKFCVFCACCLQSKRKTQELGQVLWFLSFFPSRSKPKTQKLELGGSKTAKLGLALRVFAPLLPERAESIET